MIIFESSFQDCSISDYNLGALLGDEGDGAIVVIVILVEGHDKAQIEERR